MYVMRCNPPLLTMALWLAAVWLAGCTGARFEGGVFREGEVAYRVGTVTSEWRRVQVEEGNLAFKHERGGTLFANAICGEKIDDVPLDVLTNHLLMGVEDRREGERNTFTLDGRAAMRTVVQGTVDGVLVTLDLVVLKKDNCTYDMQLIAAPGDYGTRRVDFERFFGGFSTATGG